MADKLETESRIQQDCIRYFRNMYCLKHHKPQLIMFSVPNEGKDLREQLNYFKIKLFYLVTTTGL